MGGHVWSDAKSEDPGPAPFTSRRVLQHQTSRLPAIAGASFPMVSPAPATRRATIHDRLNGGRAKVCRVRGR